MVLRSAELCLLCRTSLAKGGHLCKWCALACADLKVPKFDPSQQLKKVDAEFEPLLQSATELEAFSKKREQEIQAEIATIDKESVRPNSLVVAVSCRACGRHTLATQDQMPQPLGAHIGMAMFAASLRTEPHVQP